uniref:Uncharacterized protein n=1 Tax=Anguilla anguilla TaxID=7936 RepID=A0A0E9SBJ2_ANGAN
MFFYIWYSVNKHTS